MARSNNAPAHVSAVAVLSGSAALLLGAMAAAPAWAHDTLIGSTPEAGAVLEESPEEIVLEFSGEGLTTGESIPNTIWVTDEDGDHWETETETDGPTMRTELEDPLPNGEYEVLYHAVYSDGHSEELDFSFEVDAADVEESDDAAAEEQATEAAQETEAGEEPTAEEAATEETSGEESGVDDEAEGQFPVGVALGIGAGVLVLMVVALLLVRRKITQGGQD